MAQRFPDVDWFCDNCGAYLNYQPGFNDHHYIWKCTQCGFKSSISSANIRSFGKMEKFKNKKHDKGDSL